MKRHHFITGSMLFLFLATGCAQVTVSRVTPGAKTNGLPFFLAQPFLLVRSEVEVQRCEDLYTLKPAQLGDPNALTNRLVASSRECTSSPPAPTKSGTLGGSMQFATLRTPAPTPRPAQPSSGERAGASDADKEGRAEDEESKDKPDPPPASGGGGSEDLAGIEVVWLPDYCEQFAIRQHTFLASQSLKYNLADGWRLTSLETEVDSTAVVSKLLDVAGAALGVSTGGEAKAEAGSAVKGLGLQGAGAVTLRRTKITYLQPGVYPVFERTACTSYPSLSARLSAGLRESVVWSVLEIKKDE